MKQKNFSSGMYVKLAFSTAIQTDSDVLLVDEVLSVGNESFQKKCTQKIDEIRRAGKTIVFVSYALGTVKDLCNRCVLSDEARIVASGKADLVVGEYLNIIGNAEK